MFKEYFFVPGNDLKKINKATSFQDINLVIDLEDALAPNELSLAFENLQALSFNTEKTFIRINLDLIIDKPDIVENNLKKFNRFIIPKISSDYQWETTKKIFQGKSLVLLVESAWLLMNLNQILKTEKNTVDAIGFGSHDYSADIGVKHSSSQVMFARQMILNIAKAYKKEAIDIASMELKDENLFKDECAVGFDLGYDAKFFIHPIQLKWAREISYFSKEEIQWAKDLLSRIPEDLNDFGVIKMDNKVIERPHILRAKKILGIKN